MEGNRKQEIRQHAQRMFRWRGYVATSMRDLAKEVKIKPASLYNHLESKEDLLRQICFEMAEEFFKNYAKATRGTQDLAEKLVNAAKAHVELVTRRTDESVIFQREWRHLSPDLRKQFVERRDEYERNFQNIIEEGEEMGVFKVDDTHFYCRTLLSALNGVYEWYKPDGDLSPDQIGERIADLYLRGIKK